MFIVACYIMLISIVYPYKERRKENSDYADSVRFYDERVVSQAIVRSIGIHMKIYQNLW